MDLIHLVLLVVLIPLCFAEKDQTKALIDNAELSRNKRSKLQTTVNQLQPDQARQIVHLLHNKILPTRFRQGTIIRTKPIIEVKPRQQTNYVLNDNEPVQNEFEQQKPHIPIHAHFRTTENDDNKPSVRISKNNRISQLYGDSTFANNDTSLKLTPKKAKFFLESDDDKDDKNINVDSNKSEVIRKQNKSKTVQTDKSAQQILNTDFKPNLRKTSTNTELEEDQLSAEIKKTVITKKDDVDVLKTVVDQLPDLIQSLLNRGVTPKNLEVSKNKTESDKSKIEKPSLETSKLTNIYFNRSDDVSKLLLKPILRSEFNESANVADSNKTGSNSDYLVNDIPDSIKFKQLNHEEVIKTKQEPVQKITPNLKKFKIEMQRKLSKSDHVTAEAPYRNLQHYAYDSPKCNDGYRIYQIPYGNNLLPYEYPAQDIINANTYTYNLKDCYNPKSDVTEDNRNTIWKLWSNTEVIMRNGQNNYETEDKMKQIIPQNPQIWKDYRFDKYVYPNGYNYYLRRYPNSYSNTKVVEKMAQVPQISQYKFDSYYLALRNYYQKQYQYHYPHSYSYSNSWHRYPAYCQLPTV